MNTRERKVELLRNILGSSVVNLTDDKLLDEAKGSFLEAQIDMKIAADSFTKAITVAFFNNKYIAALRAGFKIDKT